MNDHASSEVQAVATVGGALTDLIELAERLPVPPDQAEATARILDRVAEEIAEAAGMLRGTHGADLSPAFPAWRGAANPCDAFGSDEHVACARALLAEEHEPLVMTPGDVRGLLARFQRAAAWLLDVIDGDRR